MRQANLWIPDSEALGSDRDEFEVLVQSRYTDVLRDMKDCGYDYLIWNNWQPSGPGTELYEWLRSRDHMVSYISYVLRVCYGFKTVGDALLFKLTFG